MGLTETGQLVRAALDGGREARSALLERLRPRLVLWAATRMSPALRARVEPEDVAQEVLLAVHRGIDAFDAREPGAFLAWVFRVGENRIRDLVDHFGAAKRRLPEPRERTRTSPSSAAARGESLVRLRQALDELPPRYQEVIRLRRIQGLECPQVAEILGRSENAVRVLYCRALKALGERLRGGA